MAAISFYKGETMIKDFFLLPDESRARRNQEEEENHWVHTFSKEPLQTPFNPKPKDAPVKPYVPFSFLMRDAPEATKKKRKKKTTIRFLSPPLF
jgi:hypothetical protein